MFPVILVARLATDLHAAFSGVIRMPQMQSPFAGEGMAIATAAARVGIDRRMTGRAIGIQRPVGNPHLGVGRIGIDHPAGGTVAIRPSAGVMEIVHGIPRAAIHVMTSRSAATALVAVPQGVHAAGVTGHAVAASGRNGGLQVRYGGMAEGTVAAVGDVNRLVHRSTRIVAARACRPVVVLDAANRHVPGRNMGRVRD